ncbi:MAG: lplA [Gemmataceae bacterium]|nr:lplA [Gemmataceae bacterium]
MTLLDLTLPDPAANLALDEALLLAAEEGAAGEVLRLWESPTYAVVVGAGGSVAIDVNGAACAADGVPVLRRASGGGTVVIGPGCLCFAVVLRADREPGMNLIQPSARYVMGRVLAAVRPLAPDAAVEAVSDLATGGRKFSGSAQQRKRRFFLHHGTLFGGFDLDRVSRYLNPPERQPAYRLNRPHREFVTSLPADPTTLKQLIVAAWEPEGAYGPLPMDTVRELVAEKYGRDEWNRRR